MSAPETQAAADRAACAALIRHGSKSFHAASLLLPYWLREPAYALYAFCRIADDEVDLGRDQQAAADRLAVRLHRIYAGEPADSVSDRAFAEVVQQHAIPRELPDALVEGLAWDATGRRYTTLEELEAYAARVASTVGAMMTLLMGVRDADAIARACDLGVAMQLTNIARDVGEDAQNGRVYLPTAWLEDAGIDPDAFVAEPHAYPAVTEVVRRLLDVADERYRRSIAGIASLPAGCRLGIYAARLLYGEIGAEVRRRGYDSISGRAVVSKSRKLSLLARTPMIYVLPPYCRDATAPALPATRFLVDAVRRSPAPFRAPQRGYVEERVTWLCSFFADLEARERNMTLAPPQR